MLGKITPAHFLLHFIVLIWGWSPILGRAIETEALQLVWFRIAITVVAISFYFFLVKESIKTDGKKVLILFGIGAIIAFHWFCFYNAIKVSNVSITLVAFSTGTIFTSLMEPILYRRKIIWYEIVFGLIIVGAIGMIYFEDLFKHSAGNDSGIAPKVNFGLGIIFGITAAFTSSLFTVFNGLLVRSTTSAVITFYELSGGLIALSIYLLFSGTFQMTFPHTAQDGTMSNDSFFRLPNMDYVFLGILALVGTAFPFIASTNLLRKLSPYTITLAVNLETVYGIILAALLFKEHQQLTTLFYMATCIILCVIVLNAILKNYLNKRAVANNQ